MFNNQPQKKIHSVYVLCLFMYINTFFHNLLVFNKKYNVYKWISEIRKWNVPTNLFEIKLYKRSETFLITIFRITYLYKNTQLLLNQNLIYIWKYKRNKCKTFNRFKSKKILCTALHTDNIIDRYALYFFNYLNLKLYICF